MAETYSARAITLKTTKLGETDLILTSLSQDGSLTKGVLKGARNPRSKNVGRGSVFIDADLMLVRGRSLDIITDMRIVDAYKNLRKEPERMLAASYVSEVVLRIAQEDLSEPRLFDMLGSAFSTLSSAPIESVYRVALSFIVKALALIGLRPALTHCVDCETMIDAADCNCPDLYWSTESGGIICEGCGNILSARPIRPAAIAWIIRLMMSTFDEVALEKMDFAAELVVRECIEDMFEYATGSHLKSSSLFWSMRPSEGTLE